MAAGRVTGAPSWQDGHPPAPLLSALLDGELEASEGAAVNGHLSRCARCADELAGLDGVRSAVRRLAFPTLAPGWEEQLIASVRGANREPALVLALPSMGSPSDTGAAETAEGGDANVEVYDAAVIAMRRRVAVTAAAVAAVAAAAIFSLFATEAATAPQVGRMVQSHATSSGGGDPSRLAPVAVPASFGSN